MRNFSGTGSKELIDCWRSVRTKSRNSYLDKRLRKLFLGAHSAGGLQFPSIRTKPAWIKHEKGEGMDRAECFRHGRRRAVGFRGIGRSARLRTERIEHAKGGRSPPAFKPAAYRFRNREFEEIRHGNHDRFANDSAPSTRQIRHELILMWASDELKKSEARAAAAQATLPPEQIQTSAPQLPS